MIIEELVFGGLFILYGLIAVIYSYRMEKNAALQQIHKVRSDHDWSEICFKSGLAWPVMPIVHFIMRRKNEFR